MATRFEVEHFPIDSFDALMLSRLAEQAARDFERYERCQDVADEAFQRAMRSKQKVESYRARHTGLVEAPAIRMEIV